MHGRPGGRAAASGKPAEESPGSTKQGWRVTPAGFAQASLGKVPQRADRTPLMPSLSR